MPLFVPGLKICLKSVPEFRDQSLRLLDGPFATSGKSRRFFRGARSLTTHAPAAGKILPSTQQQDLPLATASNSEVELRRYPRRLGAGKAFLQPATVFAVGFATLLCVLRFPQG